MEILERPLSAGSKSNNPNLIVIHAMGEYIKDPNPILAVGFLDKLKLSAHALILPNGDVMMCRRPDQGAYHARGFNTDSLGIEFLVSGLHDYGSFLAALKTDWVTDKQWDSGVELVKHWKENYGIEKVKRHSDLSPGRKVDPGTGFKWNKFKHEINS